MRPTTMKFSAILTSISCFVALFFLILLLPTNCDAQTKWNLAVNLGVFQPVGKDVVKLYTSTQQPISIIYNTRHKFDHPYIGILPNLSYSVSSVLSFGIQTGIYGHIDERNSGYRKRFFVTVPVMGTSKINLAAIKKNSLGLHIAAGRNFFHYNSFPYDVQNGWIYNASAFYSTKKGIFKFGIEQQVDNAFVYYVSDNQFTKDETFRYKLTHSAITISYGYIVN
jgi:hypothetical protein